MFLVFLSHFTQYYPQTAEPGGMFYYVKHYSGQLIVTMFLFYSGYGIFESIKRKGTDYVRAFPKNRILKTVFHLDCAVLIYYIINLVLGIKFSLPRYLVSLIGWESVGNSNWFMFAVIIQYFIVYVSFIVFRKHRLPALIAVTVLAVVYMAVMSELKDSYWYNTALCLPIGLWYSYLKEFTEKVIIKNQITYWLIFAITSVLFVISYKHSRNILAYEAWTAAFIAVVLLLTMKVNICNKVLLWLGDHVFSVYILQRIPMLIFRETHVKFSSMNLCFAVCFSITIVLSLLFDLIMNRIDKRLFTSKKPKELPDSNVNVLSVPAVTAVR